MDGGAAQEGPIGGKDVRLIKLEVPLGPRDGAGHDPGVAAEDRDFTTRFKMEFQAHKQGELNHNTMGRSNGEIAVRGKASPADDAALKCTLKCSLAFVALLWLFFIQ